MSVNSLNMQTLANGIRARVIELSHQAKTPHLASALSCIDILTIAYWELLNPAPIRKGLPQRDRFIFSKGHAAPALYVTLAERGIIDEALLDSYCQPGSPLSEQPTPHSVPGMEAATGSLGHGLPIGVGMALASKIQGWQNQVVVLMSDGECNEGSVWEAAMLAPAQSLNNLLVIVDYNKWQATGRSNEILSLAPLKEKWEAFGWESLEVDGHDHQALSTAMGKMKGPRNRPLAIVAHTVKGKGVSFMEDDNNWHYRLPTAEEVTQAKQELGITP